MPKQTEPPAIVRISTNTIINGKFYKRGEPLPFTKVEDLPPNLRPLVVTNEPEEDEEPEGARGSFQMNTLYEVTDDNRLGRRVRGRVERQVAVLQAENEEQDWIEEEVNSAELPAEVAQDLQAEHERDIDMQRAQAQADAARAMLRPMRRQRPRNRLSFMCAGAAGTMHRPSKPALKLANRSSHDNPTAALNTSA